MAKLRHDSHVFNDQYIKFLKKKKKFINILIILTYENTILNKSYNKPKYFINDYVLEYNYIDINILISFSILIFYLSYTCLEQKYDI